MIKKIFLIGILLMSICIISVNAQSTTTGAVGISLLNQNPDPVRAGDIVELRFKIENTGGKDVNNIAIDFVPKYPFTEIAGETYSIIINTLFTTQTGNNAEIIKFKVRVDSNAVQGANEISLKEGIVGSSSYSTNTFDVEVSSQEFAQIEIDKSQLDPGKETNLTFTITNTGSSPLENLAFSWSEDKGSILPVYSDVTKYVKFVDVGQSIQMKYVVVADINANPGLYALNLNLQFDTTGGSKQVTTKAGISVGGQTDFDVSFSESSAGQTSLSVANIGNNPALSVTVSIPEQQNFKVTGSTSSIVGNLDKGDYTVVSFQITNSGSGRGNISNINQLSQQEIQNLRQQFAQRNVSGNNNLKVNIDYTDTTGARHSIEKDVQIQFRSSTTTGTTQTGQFRGQGNNNNNLYWIIGIVAVLGIAAVFYFRKRKIVNEAVKTIFNGKK
jgi:hypothetical protein